MNWLIVELLVMCFVGVFMGWFVRSIDVSESKKQHEKTKSELDAVTKKMKERGVLINELSNKIGVQNEYAKTLDKYVNIALSELNRAKKEDRPVSPYAVRRPLKKIINRRFFKDE